MTFTVGGSTNLTYDTTDTDFSEGKDLKSSTTGNTAVTGKTVTDGISVNSGSVNTGTNTSKGGSSTAASQNTTTNSGSVNVSGSSGSKNTTVQGPSTQTTVNSGSVNTSQLLLTEDATNYLVKQLLQGTQGLAAITASGHAAGGYDSTTQQLLINDLASNVAGEVASRSAKTVNTIGGSTSTTTNSGSTTTQNIGAAQNYETIGGSMSTQNIGATNTSNFNVSDALNNIGGFSNSSTNTSNTFNNTATTGSTVSREDINGAQNSSNYKINQEGHASFGWIICTELHKQGKLPNRLYIEGSKKFKLYDDKVKTGYYYWAIPAVKHLKKYPNSEFSKLLEIIFYARAMYITAETRPKKAKKSIFGAITTYGVYAFCWILSRTVARNYTPYKSNTVGAYHGK